MPTGPGSFMTATGPPPCRGARALRQAFAPSWTRRPRAVGTPPSGGWKSRVLMARGRLGIARDTRLRESVLRRRLPVIPGTGTTVGSAAVVVSGPHARAATQDAQANHGGRHAAPSPRRLLGADRFRVPPPPPVGGRGRADLRSRPLRPGRWRAGGVPIRPGLSGVPGPQGSSGALGPPVPSTAPRPLGPAGPPGPPRGPRSQVIGGVPHPARAEAADPADQPDRPVGGRNSQGQAARHEERDRHRQPHAPR